jgi:4-carboxymuconolactone decarboxylase
MSSDTGLRSTMDALDQPTRALVMIAAIVTAAGEPAVRAALERAVHDVPHDWLEELLLQSYLFAGFPRALNAMREWRRLSGRIAPESDESESVNRIYEWQERGEQTCAVVYGRFYEKLRHNIRQLHPALDSWMIVDGYGKVLGRPGLDLVRRELCIIAACVAAGQDRQLHSHLHGALHAGASAQQVDETLDALDGHVDGDALRSARMLWVRVRR